MQCDLIIGIDPAGIGNNGIVIYSNETNSIVLNKTFKTKNILESKDFYKIYFQITKNKFIDKKILVIVENFFLTSKQLLTNPLATPKIIGALMVLVEDVMNWDYLESEPKNKTKIENYKVDTTNINATYQSTDYDNMNILDLQDVIYYKNLLKITMAGDIPTNAELETVILNIGNNGYEKGKATFSNITSTSSIISGNNKDYYGTVKLKFTKK